MPSVRICLLHAVLSQGSKASEPKFLVGSVTKAMPGPPGGTQLGKGLCLAFTSLPEVPGEPALAPSAVVTQNGEPHARGTTGTTNSLPIKE